MAEAPDNRILAIGRDALLWLEKVKKLNKEITKRVIYEEAYHYNLSRTLKEGANKIAAERDALKVSIEQFRKREVAANVCMNNISIMRTEFHNIMTVLEKLRDDLKGIEKGVLKELKEAKYAQKELAGFEAEARKLMDLNEFKAHKAHVAVKKLVRHTRYDERREKQMVRHIDDIAGKIKDMIKDIDFVISNVGTDEFNKSLRAPTGEIVPYITAEIRAGRMGNVVRMFNLFVVAANIFCSQVKGRVEKIADDHKRTVLELEAETKEIEKFEARNGALLEELQDAIKTYTAKGWMSKKALAA